MRAVDSSIAVAAFGDWHELNGSARRVLDGGAALPAHALLETYSVLTGFPPPYRASPELVGQWLDSRFTLVLPSPEIDQQRSLIRRLADERRTGGAVYDALVALTAKLRNATLVTADQRALGIYELVGVDVEFVTN
ncbi:MAG TPA: PIN domain-containing protein [Thermoanaerobaculia bacterium]|nr:PIN domain-containing protein [Thermoanaerobaculia bacterium]